MSDKERDEPNGELILRTSALPFCRKWASPGGPILHENEDKNSRFKVTDAAFTYVAIDAQGNKQRIKRTDNT